LLDGGAEVLAKENTGKTALHLAAERGHALMITVLLEAGADMHDGDNVGDTVRLVVALHGCGIRRGMT
jgi:ankyrin repeat protein